MKGESSVLTVPAPQQEVGSITQEQAAPGKPKPERKRTGRLSEDKRLKIFRWLRQPKTWPKVFALMSECRLGESKLQRFADGEIYFQLLENVRG